MERRPESDQPLRGMRILIADDEILIALDLEDILATAGAEVVSAATVSAAVDTARHEALNGALLDVRIGRQTSEPVAAALAERGIPFVFYSGHTLPDEMRAKFPDARVLIKPVARPVFVSAMLALVGHGCVIR